MKLKNFGKIIMNNNNKFLLKKRLVILKFAKKVISKNGINNDIFKIISSNHGLKINEIELLFPEGESDLIKFALDQLNEQLEVYCKNLDLIRLPVHKRIRKVLLSKIFLMDQEKRFYKKIFFYILIPKKNLSFTNQLYKSVDKIWSISGDSSVDFNFYTKRLILSAIYSRIMLFFFNNDNQKKLEALLDESLKKVSKIPKIKSKLNLLKEYFPKILKFVKVSN
tara:strand:+ start:357 stop:1025 length:669 start_codon:yes stop_codon:yes gene_type:complete